MTNEEAKNLYNSNEFQETICHSKLCNYANTGCSDCEITNMGILLIEALEKQIPKKPDEYMDKFYGCPRCSNLLMHKWEKYPTLKMDKRNGLPYCLGCGQAIDWSEGE